MRVKQKGYYTYVFMTKEEIGKIPEYMKNDTSVKENAFMMLGNFEEEELLKSIYGQDLPVTDWFIVLEEGCNEGV